MTTPFLLGLIPARAGSKRVADKNGRPFAGTTLLQWSVGQALAARALDRVGLSTDSPRYRDLAAAEGLAEDYLRPDSLATDQAGSAELVLDYLDWLASRGAKAVTHVVLLQPTSPFRTAAAIDDAVAAWRHSGRPGLISVTPAAPDHRFLVRADAETGLTRLDPGLAPLLVLEGSLYITPVERLRATGKFWDAESLPWVIAHPRPHDIDTPEDFRMAERMLAGEIAP